MRGFRLAAVGAVAALLAATLVTSPGSAAPGVSVTATPASDLVDGQVIQVTVSGATPGDHAYTLLCRTDAAPTSACSQGFNHLGVADETGTVVLELGVEAAFTTFDGVTVDCRVAPGCAMVTNVSRADETGAERYVTPLAFRPDGPLLPPPTLAVDPSTDLLDGTVAHVTGAGFIAGSPIEVVQCQVPFANYEDCESPRTYQQIGNDGTLAADVYLPAVIFTNRGDEVDCRVVACELVATRNLFLYEARHTARAELDFLADAPLGPPPVLSVVPAEGLTDGQVVQVSGTGFRPGPVVIGQCAAGTTQAFQRCSGTLFLEADADGVVSAPLEVSVLAGSQEGFTDCREAPGCTIEALDLNFFAPLVVTPITFDPDGPDPVFPTVTVAPGGPLAARSGAIVSGSGFTPGGFVELQQCRIEDDLPRECTYLSAGAQVDAQGGFFTGTIVTAIMAGPDGTEVDCRRVECAVVANSFDGYPGVGPLDFGEPPRRGPGRYLEPVFDDIEVTEGVVYRQTTNSRGIAVDLKLDIYRPAGDTETARPAVMWMFGGYFGSGDRVQLQEMAQAMARRGYVSISIDYRTRPEIFSGANGCVNVGGTCLDPSQLPGAITDARDDARAAMVWLHEHAAEYGIEPRAISAAGWSAGAITALNLAHDATGDRPADSIPAAAISLAGILFGAPQAGDPPSLMMGGSHDTLLPMGSQIAGCGSIVAAGSSCEFVAYSGLRPAPEADECVRWVVTCTYVLGRNGSHGWFFSERPDTIDRIARFLAAEVLDPLGLLPRPPDRPHHPRPHRPHDDHGHHHHPDHHHRDHDHRDHDDHHRDRDDRRRSR